MFLKGNPCYVFVSEHKTSKEKFSHSSLWKNKGPNSSLYVNLSLDHQNRNTLKIIVDDHRLTVCYMHKPELSY
jgi:hypothetical protein